jgi:hypothetical protein
MARTDPDRADSDQLLDLVRIGAELLEEVARVHVLDVVHPDPADAELVARLAIGGQAWRAWRSEARASAIT